MKLNATMLIAGALLCLAVSPAAHAQPGFLPGKNVDNRRTPLMRAAGNGRAGIVRMLLAVGANIDARDSNYNTALHDAARSGHAEVVRSLLERGACVKTRGNGAQTPLMMAAGHGRTEAVGVLLEAGAKVNEYNYRDKTALHEAAESGHADAIRLLIEYGAHLNTGGYRTPLMLAAEGGHLAAMEALLDAGANIDTTNRHKKNAIELAARSAQEAAVNLLLERGAACNPEKIMEQLREGQLKKLNNLRAQIERPNYHLYPKDPILQAEYERLSAVLFPEETADSPIKNNFDTNDEEMK